MIKNIYEAAAAHIWHQVDEAEMERMWKLAEAERLQQLIEVLAALAHKQWFGWMRYLFDKCDMNQDGTATIPKWAVERWQRQVNTPYEELPEEEKESDRKEARMFLAALEGGQTND